MNSKILSRFLDYCRINSASNINNETYPSTEGQKVFAKYLKNDLLSIGIKEDWINVISGALIICEIPASPGHENCFHTALTAHIDTVGTEEMIIIPHVHFYKGGDLILPCETEKIAAEELRDFKNQKIITSDGKTILGADDKAGLAGIVTVVEMILKNEKPHGPITLVFCPDEEIGRVSGKVLPADKVREWDVLWSVDGWELNMVDVECFFGQEFIISFKGEFAAPGMSGKNIKPAHYAATKFIDILNNTRRLSPWESFGRDPYMYVVEIKGSTWEASIIGRFLAFKKEEMDDLKKFILETGKVVGNTFPGVKLATIFREICINTLPIIKNKPFILSPVASIFNKHGLEVVFREVRGGTDGAMINMEFPDLPAPNMGCGVRNMHQNNEWIPVSELKLLPKILADLIYAYAEMEK